MMMATVSEGFAIEILHGLLPQPTVSVKDALDDEDCLSHLCDLAEPLLLMHRSLMETGDEHVANGHLLDLIRQVHSTSNKRNDLYGPLRR